MAKFNLIRVVTAACALTALSFAVGVAGDLSQERNSGMRVVLRIPPELPANTPRAGPLPPLPMTQTAAAETPRVTRITVLIGDQLAGGPEEVVEARAKPTREHSSAQQPKADPDRAPKHENRSERRKVA